MEELDNLKLGNKCYDEESVAEIARKIHEAVRRIKEGLDHKADEKCDEEEKWEVTEQVFRSHFEEKVRELNKSLDNYLKELEEKLKGKPYVKKKSLEVLAKKIGIAKLDVMRPAYTILGPSVKTIGLGAEELADLMYQKHTTYGQFRQVISGLARWQMLDGLQSLLKPQDFGPCFAALREQPKHGGRPVEEIYENVDKDRLRDTLEALHREKYRLPVKEGWGVSKERTRHFLLAFMLSLFKHPLGELDGKMKAFSRFFSEFCGYAFTAARNLQYWFNAYRKFNVERDKRNSNMPKNEPDKNRKEWLKNLKIYDAVERMAEWMYSRYPHYGVCTPADTAGKPFV